MEKAKTYSFSAAGHDKVWLEGYKQRLGAANFSEAVIDGLKALDTRIGRSDVEKQFDEYCRRNHLSKDAQLCLLMGPYRVCNSGIDEPSEDKQVSWL